MEKVCSWCGQSSDRGRQRNRTELQERLQSTVMSMSARISPEPCTIFTKFFVHVAYVALWHADDRPHQALLRRHFFQNEKKHYRPGKGDGSAQRGRSMLSTTALLLKAFKSSTSKNITKSVVMVALCNRADHYIFAL